MMNEYFKFKTKKQVSSDFISLLLLLALRIATFGPYLVAPSIDRLT